MSLVLEIPDSIEEALRFPLGQQVDELFKELAVALYARNALSFSKACFRCRGPERSTIALRFPDELSAFPG